MPSTPVVSVNGLRFGFGGRPVFDGMSFDVPPASPGGPGGPRAVLG
jgi:ABC-type transporter Mla maintaining outer membrane lipid asymmetry ATPase subunit MlaF